MSKVRLVLERSNLDANGVLISKVHRTFEVESEELEYLLADKSFMSGPTYNVIGSEVVDAKGASERADERANAMAEDF